MIVSRLALGALAAAYLAAPAPAADKPLRSLFGPPAPKAPRTYPLAESRYIKQFAGPTISCGACFGYYHTQWKPWAEACNEPGPVEAGPPMYDVPVEPVPELEKPAVPKVEKPKEPAPVPMSKEKLPEPKPPERKKKVDSTPSIPLPALQPATTNAIQISIPAAPPLVLPQAKPIPVLPVEPMPAIPTIIVPLNSK